MTESGIYDELLSRPDVDEIDPREIREGMSIIGNREAVANLAADGVAAMTGEAGSLVTATVDQILGERMRVQTAVHNWRGRDGLPLCVRLMTVGSGGVVYDVSLSYGDPVLRWTAPQG